MVTKLAQVCFVRRQRKGRAPASSYHVISMPGGGWGGVSGSVGSGEGIPGSGETVLPDGNNDDADMDFCKLFLQHKTVTPIVFVSTSSCIYQLTSTALLFPRRFLYCSMARFRSESMTACCAMDKCFRFTICPTVRPCDIPAASGFRALFSLRMS